jgi:predicted dehydrogenase
MLFTRSDPMWSAEISGVAPSPQALGADRQFRYCVVGLGRVSIEHFMPGTKLSKYTRVTAIVSGHRAKAEKMAAKFGVYSQNIYDYENFDAIADNEEIDAVYIALPNGMHAEYTIRAAQAGKHVLCEKPMANTALEAQQMVNACRLASKKLMIAYRCPFESMNLRAIGLIQEGRLGRIQSIESANGFNIQAGEWRLNKRLGGGGPLIDSGIYSLNACRYLTGEEPIGEIKGYSSVIDRDGRFTEVEENLAWTMRFPSGAVASCATTYGASMPGMFTVYGSSGTLHMESAFGYQGQHLTAKCEGGPSIDEHSSERDPSHFTVLADHLALCAIQNQEPWTPGEEGLKDMNLIMAIYQSCDRPEETNGSAGWAAAPLQTLAPRLKPEAR